MITLNTEKELVQIESWDDIVRRPGFCEEIDPATAELKELIGTYHLRDEVRCGLKNCHTPHNRGYLAVTQDGRETNIGHQCGAKYFGVENFEAARKLLEREVRRKANRDAVRAFQATVPFRIQAIERLRAEPEGADWAQRSIGRARLELPAPVVRLIAEMLKAGDAHVYVERERTQEEIERDEVRAGGQPRRFTRDAVALIEGLDCMRPDSDLRELLIVDLSLGLERLAEVDAEAEHPTALAQHARWVGEFDLKLERAGRIVREARRFLAKKNLMKFEIALGSKDASALRAFANAVMPAKSAEAGATE